MIDPATAIRNPDRLAALRRLDLLDTPAEEVFDRLTKVAAKLLHAPIALVSLVDEHRQFFKSCVGLPEPLASQRETPLSYSFCQYVVASGMPFIVNDARAHPALQEHPATREFGIVAYAGMPLTTQDGHTVGAFCVLDFQPRAWQEEEITVLQDLAASVLAIIERRAGARERAQLLAQEQALRVEAEMARQRLAFLAEASVLLASSLDYENTLASLADLTVSFLADWCTIIVRGDNSTTQRLAVAHADPAMRGHLLDLLNRCPPDLDALFEVGKVLRTGKAELCPDVTAAELATRAATDERFRVFCEWGLTSYMITPLAARGRVLGAMVFNSARPDRRYTAADLTLAQELAHHAALAIDNAQLYQQAQAARQALHRQLDFTRALTNSLGEGVFATDNEGYLTFVNQTAEQILGKPMLDLIGRKAQEVIRFQQTDGLPLAPEAYPLLVALQSGATVQSDEYLLCREDDLPLPVTVTASPIRIDTSIVGTVVAFRDLSQRKRYEEELRTTHDTLQTLIQASPLAIITYDTNGHVTRWNPAAERLFGWRAEEVRGHPPPHIPEESWDEFRELFRRRLQGEVRTSIELRRRRRDGSLIDISVSAAPLYGSSGAVCGVVALIADITARKRMEEELRQMNETLRAIMQSSPLAIIALDLDRKVKSWNAAAEQMFGWKEEEVLGRPIPVVPPEALAESIAQHQQVIQEKRIITTEVRHQRRDGTLLDISLAKAPLYDAQGQVSGVIGIGVDITERKHMEAALRKSEQRFRSLVQNLSDIIAVMDSDGTLRYISPSLQRVLGYRPEDFVGTTMVASCRAIAHPDDADLVARFFDESHSEQGSERAIEFRVRHRNGSWRYLKTIAINLLHEPDVNGILLSCRDTTDRRLFEEQLTQQAFYDPLTGLPNRALFMNRLQHALARTRLQDESIAVLFLDLDRFKVINDSLGHAAGDDLLIAIGRRLGACLRSGDTIARFGGDEFTVLLEGISGPQDAMQAAKRTLTELSHPLHVAGHEVSVSGSIGIALNTPGRSSPEDLLRNADIALYRAKAQGGCRYVLFQDEHDPATMEQVFWS